MGQRLDRCDVSGGQLAQCLDAEQTKATNDLVLKQFEQANDAVFACCGSGQSLHLSDCDCIGTEGHLPYHRPDANPYRNRFATETALFKTSEGASSRMSVSWSMKSIYGESGRVFGERGCMNGTQYQGLAGRLPDLARPPLPPGVPAGGHGGSHGLLMQEFITAILEDRDPLVDVYEALAMTVPGIVAHQSALRGGERLPVPQYRKRGTPKA